MTWEIKVESIKPLRGKILIRPIGDVDKIGSIHVPATAKDRPQKGEVIAVGAEVHEVEVGDIVIYHPWADSANFRLTPWGEVLAMVDEKVCEGKLVVPLSQ